MASSGIGGSNGHVVLEGPPEIRSLANNVIVNSERPVLLVAGGLSPRSTSSVAQSVLKAVTDKDQDLPVVSTILGRRSKQMTWRSFAVSNSSSLSTSVFSPPQYIARFANPVVMIFSGQGPQHDDMGKELFKEFPVFRDSILEMDEVFKSMTGKSIIHDFGLFRWDSESKLRDTWPISIILPSIAMFQVALFDLFVSLGIKPDVVVGHSAGETAMLYASGAAPKAMAVELAIIRGKAFSSVESHGGTMAALSCGLEEASGILEEERSDNPGSIVEVACLNSPSAVAIAGHEIAIDRVVKVAQSRGIFARKIHTKVPIHSSMMDACQQEYCGMLRDLFTRYPGSHKSVIPVYSTLTGKLFSDPFDAQYFWDNTRSQVRFSEVVEALGTSRDYTYIELSPHPVLSSYVSSMVPESSHVLSTIRRPKSGTPSVEYRNVLELCGKLTVNGHNCVDFTALNGRACYDAEVDLPDYPFSKKRFNLYPDTAGYAKQMEPQFGPLNNKHLRVNKETHPTLAEHIIRGEPIMPAAGFMEMAIEFGASTLMNVNLRSMLSLSSESPIKVEASLDGSYWTVKSIATSPQSRKDSKLKPVERLHADGYLSFEPPQTCCDLDIPSIRKRCPEHVSSAFYPSLSYFSSYGPTLRRVTNLYYGDKEALASIRGIDHKLATEGDYILHPAILDACLQITAYKPFHGDFDPNVYYLPARVEAVIVHKALRPQYFPAHVYAHIKLGMWTPASMHYDIALVDDKGSHLCTLKGLEVAKHRITPLTPTQKSYDINWQPVPHPLRPSHSCVVLPSTQDRPTLFSVIDNLARGGLANTKTNVLGSVPAPELLLCDPSEAFIFRYEFGCESDLQWHFSGLNRSQQLDIWVVAKEGQDGGAASGLVRALNRECPLWTIRLVVFPLSYTEEMEEDSLQRLPSCMKDESEIMISPEGVPFVPRMTPLPETKSKTLPAMSSADLIDFALDQILVRIISSFKGGKVYGFIGSVVNNNGTSIDKGALVVGLTAEAMKEHAVVDIASVCAVSLHVLQVASVIAARVPGCVASVLAPGLSLFNNTSRLKSQRILLTHSDTDMGSVIKGIYSHKGLEFETVTQETSLLELATMGSGPFDLIVSGYDDKPHIQVLKNLLSPGRGKLFLWEDEATGLIDILQRDPCSIGDALRNVIPLLENHDSLLDETTPLGTVALPNGKVDVGSKITPRQRSSFDANKTYLILGGIGSVGVHITLFMYERGARHIILTSRSGEDGLRKNKNKILHRMLDYVKRLKGLNIRLEAVDASSSIDMAALIEPLKTPLGGCMILTAVLSDGAFQHLTEEDFSASFACKSGVLDTVKDTIDISNLDFLIAFSSVSGAFGIQGQTNYGAANTLLEQQMSLFPNGFTFICPGILDSSLMLASGSDKAELRLNHLIDWSISAEDMIRWLDDAFCKHQNNYSFSRYIPHLNWEAMDGTHGMSKIGKHLVPAKSQSATRASAKSHIDGMADMICSALGILPNDFSAEVPLTTYGLDSLSASRLSFILRPIVEVTQIQLLADLSLNDIWRKVPASSSDVESKTIISTSVKAKTDHVAELLAKYAARIPSSTPLQDDGPVASSDQVILLTGSTGALGCNILYHLIGNDVVKRIYAFNRRNTNGIPLWDRQRDAFEAQGLPSSLVDSPKVTLLEGDLAASDFRVPTKVLDELLSTVTHVIHNAWRVDFVAPLADFEDLVEGTYGLITFALRSKLPVRPSLSFISSIGVCQQFRGTSAVPEIPMIDPCIDLQTNYIKSKWVAERLFQIAGEKSLLRTNVIRVGLLSGGLNGFWDTSHWLPALVQSSSYVGCLPEGDEMISWIPINLAAAAIVDMRSVANETLHVIHPQPVKWATVLEPLASLLDVPLVPFAEWHARLEHLHGADSQSNPSKSSSNDNMSSALKLTDFYRMGLNGGPQSSTESMGLLPKVASKKGFHASAALMDNRLVPLGPNDAQMWVKYWREVGFLPS
ncbi:hypothetical protein SERLA73DRAFT_97544 [Serpula lacrymans var. lacrymans S7.3]|uniref:PKS/mFAS DH domain-containing protein n=1 Tax=Serpula lacrymans var. lacrymans (strain S7.3) TaxID=936435 RepID=F8QDD5_SERL3|nr:hypothetical protein SERLA73DRAFT_97544 [Serpula lacrymans var. lacrymans S7.3]